MSEIESTTAAGTGTTALTHRQILVVFAGLATALLLASLDQTIVATALPTIVGEFGGLHELSWVVTAYLLTSTVSVPLWGKISDLYGRKRVFQAAIVIFLLGSILCGMAQNMAMLIAFRALQGVGGGGMMALTQAIIGDVVSPRERGRYQGYLGAVFAFSSVVGPLLGGFFVDHLSWRWVFYINVPLGIASLVITSIVLNLPFKRIQHRIDYLGAALVMGGATCLLLVTVWGGDQYAWGSPTIIGLALAGVALLVAFFVQEGRTSEPIIPLRLWRNPVFAVATGLEFLVGLAMFGSIIFLPLYLQTVGGASATNSGLLILPLMVGLMVMSIVSGRIITRTGRYKIFPIVGTAVTAIGLWLLSTMGVGTSWIQSSVYMVILGAGIGCIIQVMVIAVQNAVEHRDLGTATGVETFARSMGGSFGVAIYGAVLNNRLTHYLNELLPPGAAGAVDPRTLASSPAAIARLPEELKTPVIQALEHAIQVTFRAAIPLVVIAFFVTFLLKEKPLRETAHIGGSAEAIGEELLVDFGSVEPEHAPELVAPELTGGDEGES